MTFKNTFCSSPWFHLAVQPHGDYLPCRWIDEPGPHYRLLPKDGKDNVTTVSIMEYYNRDEIRQLRTALLNGEQPTECKSCYYEDGFNKLSGRQRQLLKSGIRSDEFDITLKASPHYDLFKYSLENNGLSNYEPTDLQIELGSLCNSACVMCSPAYSSRLVDDYRKLEKINPAQFQLPKLPPNWTENKEALDKFIDELLGLKSIKYVHFLGGETMYIEAFYTICERLIAEGRAKDIILGTTTNGTIYHQRLENIIGEFKQFHLGFSIETLNSVNDYIRYPSRIDHVRGNLLKLLALRNTAPNLQISLRITPNIFTMYYIDQLVEFMFEHQVIAESCNILFKPSVLRIELMPEDLRQQTMVKLKNILDKYTAKDSKVLNVRNKEFIADVIINVANDYLNVLHNLTIPDDVEDQRHKLVTFLKSWEQLRNNSILDHAPEYEPFLRLYGY
jgi:MoaA/NifB/PqqE/SkfB family radical SAM enzyme